MPVPTYTGGNQGTTVARSGSGSAAACSLTLAVTVPAGSNFLAVAFASSIQNGGTLVTPTFNGAAMSTYLALSTTGWNRNYLFYKVNPSIGTYNFVISFGTALDFALCAQAACFANVDPTNPFVSNASGALSGYTVNTTIASDPNYYILSGCWYCDRTADEKTAGVSSPSVLFGYQRRGYDDSTASPQGAFVSAGGKAGAAGTNTITWSFPYGIGGTWYNVNLRNYVPAAKARSQTIIIL